MNTNNDVWREVAKGRSQDVCRWKHQEQLLKQARVDEPKPGRNLIPAAGAAMAGILSAARKGLGGLRPAQAERREQVGSKPKSYA